LRQLLARSRSRGRRDCASGEHDVTYVRVSRAPLEKLLAYKKRMGWKAKWVSSYNSDFNYDFHVSFTKEQLAEGKV
jgi:predicted dithiol-disulfide oxidoreductase (DUF899 family)